MTEKNSSSKDKKADAVSSTDEMRSPDHGANLWKRYLDVLRHQHEAKDVTSLTAQKFPVFFCSLFFTHSITLIAAS